MWEIGLTWQEPSEECDEARCIACGEEASDSIDVTHQGIDANWSEVAFTETALLHHLLTHARSTGQQTVNCPICGLQVTENRYGSHNLQYHFKLHHTAYSLERTPEHVAKLEEGAELTFDNIPVGAMIEAQDTIGVWCEAVVMGKTAPNSVREIFCVFGVSYSPCATMFSSLFLACCWVGYNSYQLIVVVADSFTLHWRQVLI